MSSKKGIFYGIVKESKFTLDNPQLFSLFIKNFDGKRVEIIFQQESEDWTLSQFRYLYGWVYDPLAEELGYSVDEMDGVLKREFLTINKGTPKEYVREKSSLSRAELAKYIDSCIMKAAEMGVVCLPPNKFGLKEYLK